MGKERRQVEGVRKENYNLKASSEILEKPNANYDIRTSLFLKIVLRCLRMKEQSLVLEEQSIVLLLQSTVK